MGNIHWIVMCDGIPCDFLLEMSTQLSNSLIYFYLKIIRCYFLFELLKLKCYCYKNVLVKHDDHSNPLQILQKIYNDPSISKSESTFTLFIFYIVSVLSVCNYYALRMFLSHDSMQITNKL